MTFHSTLLWRRPRLRHRPLMPNSGVVAAPSAAAALLLSAAPTAAAASFSSLAGLGPPSLWLPRLSGNSSSGGGSGCVSAAQLLRGAPVSVHATTTAAAPARASAVLVDIGRTGGGGATSGRWAGEMGGGGMLSGVGADFDSVVKQSKGGASLLLYPPVVLCW